MASSIAEQNIYAMSIEKLFSNEKGAKLIGKP